jgi:predicted enzyme related to lactoylglutathione lyase
MSRVLNFEIHASDPETMAAFYTALFGWTIRKWEGPPGLLDDQHRPG